jgi:hypothetical protein
MAPFGKDQLSLIPEQAPMPATAIRAPICISLRSSAVRSALFAFMRGCLSFRFRFEREFDYRENLAYLSANQDRKPSPMALYRPKLVRISNPTNFLWRQH